MNMRLSVIWAYAKEPLLVGLVMGILLAIAGSPPIEDFVEKTGSQWANFTGLLFAASVAVWISYVNITASAFGEYLRTKGALLVYSNAFASALVIFFVSTAILIISTAFKSSIIADAAMFMLIYSTVNLMTMVRNGSGLVRMYALYKAKEEEAKATLPDVKSATNAAGTPSPHGPVK